MNNHNLNLETCSFCIEMTNYQNLMKRSIQDLTSPRDIALSTRVQQHLREVHNIILDDTIFDLDTAKEPFDEPRFISS